MILVRLQRPKYNKKHQTQSCTAYIQVRAVTNGRGCSPCGRLATQHDRVLHCLEGYFWRAMPLYWRATPSEHLPLGIASIRMTRRQVFACWYGKDTQKSECVDTVKLSRASRPVENFMEQFAYRSR